MARGALPGVTRPTGPTYAQYGGEDPGPYTPGGDEAPVAPGIPAGGTAGGATEGALHSGTATAPPPEAWIGRSRAVGVTNIGRRGRQAFNPMGDEQIVRGFNPMGDGRFRGVFGEGQQLNNRAERERRAIEVMLGRPLGPQTYDAPNAYAPERVAAMSPGATLGESRAGISEAYDAFGNLDASRAAQQAALGTATDWAAGNMPSVGQDIANEAGVVANEQFLRAGSEANQAYGMAGTDANRAYQDALAQMLASQQSAATGAARQVGDAASDAVLRQAALTSAARGGNIGMALRTGLQGAAMQSADANRQGARIMADAQRQAADIAAAGQRAAEATQAQQALATLGTQERAGFAAASAEEAARLRGAQIGSQEQQQALALQAQIADQFRGGDVAGVGAAVNMGGLGLGMDTLATNAAMSDADRAFAADQFNAGQGQQNAQFYAGMGLDYDQLNAGLGLDYDRLNSQNQAFLAGLYQGDQQFGLGLQQGMVTEDQRAAQALAAGQMGSEQALVQLLAGLDESSRQRALQDYAVRNDILNARDAMAQGNRAQNWGYVTGGAGAVGTLLAGLGYFTGNSDQSQPTGGPDASSYPSGPNSGPTTGGNPAGTWRPDGAGFEGYY